MTYKFDEIYAPLDPSLDGEWVGIQRGDHLLGYLWTDHEDGLGFRAFAPDASEEVITSLSQIQGLMRSAAALQLNTSNAFNGIVSSLTDSGYTLSVKAGPLEGLISDVNSATGGASEAGKSSNFILSVDEDGYVAGLGFISDEGIMLVRDKGKWVSISGPEDERIYSDLFYYVSEDAVNFYDNMSKATKRDLTEDEFLQFTV